MGPLLAAFAVAGAVTATLVLTPGTTAQGGRDRLWKLTPAAPEPGPLLCFISSEKISSGKAGGGARRHQVHYVFAPAAAGKPREFLRCDGNVRVLHRIDRNTILVMSHRDDYGLFLIDLEAGTSRAIIPDNHTNFLFAQDGKLFFREGVLVAGVVHSYHIGVCDELLRDEPDWLFEPAVQHQWVMDCKTTRQLLVLTANTRELWLLDLGGGRKHRKITTAHGSWLPSQSTAEVSPDGRLLAVGLCVAADPGETRAGLLGGLGEGYHLRVLEVATGKVRFDVRDIHVDVSLDSSSMPKLEVTWLDDRRLRYSETGYPHPEPAGSSHPPKKVSLRPFAGTFFRFVDVDIETGKKVVHPKYAEAGIYHRRPPRGDAPVLKDLDLPVHRRDGLFDRQSGQIFWRDGKEPLIDTRDESGRPRGWVLVSPDGRFCLVDGWGPGRSRNKPVLLDGRTRARVPLPDSWCYEFKWLPATQAVGRGSSGR